MNDRKKSAPDPEIVGLIPAAGYARRIFPLPCSKEIYPVGFTHLKTDQQSRPKVISSYLLESMQAAHVTHSFMIIREGKWDIPAYFSKKNQVPINLAFLVTGATPGVPFTLDLAYPYIKKNTILFGFPDILFEPKNAFVRLLQKQKQTSADIVLGLFKTDNHQKSDMVEMGKGNVIKNIMIKPEASNLKYTWILAVWTSVFTSFMHRFISARGNSSDELYMSEIILKAIENGLSIETVKFSNGFYLDIGTMDDLKKAIEMKLEAEKTHH